MLKMDTGSTLMQMLSPTVTHPMQRTTNQNRISTIISLMKTVLAIPDMELRFKLTIMPITISKTYSQTTLVQYQELTSFRLDTDSIPTLMLLPTEILQMQKITNRNPIFMTTLSMRTEQVIPDMVLKFK